MPSGIVTVAALPNEPDEVNSITAVATSEPVPPFVTVKVLVPAVICFEM